MIEKSVSNFSFPLGFVGKIELNFHYKKMTDKMSDNLREKYKISVFQILHLCKVFNNFGFSLTIRGKMHWVVQVLGNKVIERFLFSNHTEYLN